MVYSHFFYERLNHLGNVQVVVSDKRISVCDEELEVASFKADVLSAMDYYPFGMMMPDRQWYANSDSGIYNFGFGGQVKDDEVCGLGNSYAFEYRMYNPQIGRFLSGDPLEARYPWWTPYQFSGNIVILYRDLEGLEPEAVINEAEKYLGTLYEWNGKNPHPSMVGYIKKSKKHEVKWQTELRPIMQLLRSIWPADANADITDLAKDKKISAEGVKQSNADYYKQREMIYESMGVADWLDQGYSVGLDCSGLVSLAYRADKTLLLKTIPDGSANLINSLYNNVDEDGVVVGLIHTDFNIVVKADMIYYKGHIMLATGNVKKNEAGEVIAIQTIEAAGESKGVVRQWRTVKSLEKKGAVVGHPFRTTDKVQGDDKQEQMLGEVETGQTVVK